MKTDDLYAEIDVPAGLESRLESLIDNLADTERKSKKRAKQTKLWMSIAASAVLLLSIGLFIRFQSEKNLPVTSQQVNTIDDPEIAYLETQKALKLVSMNFNKGLNQLGIITDEIDKSNKILNKTLKK
jgi:hypothetical protein